jgi:two-component system alkaline phosphatase synthesis response regulator PhoP
MGKLIYVVEDDENIRTLVKMALSSFGYEPRLFENAEDAMDALWAQTPDLILLDIMLPKMSGLEATQFLRKNLATKSLPIILLTARDSEIDKVIGLDAGADDYIAKPFGIMELGARLRSLFRRIDDVKQCDSPQIVTVDDFAINLDTHEVTKDGKILDLTNKEYELLCILVNERNRIVTREELFSSVWGADFMGESRTLDIHVRTLRGKLGDSSEKPKFIKTLRGVGYRFIGGSGEAS